MMVALIVLATLTGIWGDLNNKKRLATVAYAASMGLVLAEIFWG